MKSTGHGFAKKIWLNHAMALYFLQKKKGLKEIWEHIKP